MPITVRAQIVKPCSQQFLRPVVRPLKSKFSTRQFLIFFILNQLANTKRGSSLANMINSIHEGQYELM